MALIALIVAAPAVLGQTVLDQAAGEAETPAAAGTLEWAALGQLSPYHWEQSALPRRGPLAVDPANLQRVAYCAPGAVHVSADGGATWREVSTLAVAAAAAATGYPLADGAGRGACADLVLDPAHPDSVYTAFEQTGGVPPPVSFAQKVRLVETPAGWRVARLRLVEYREEPGEPHGPAGSACRVGAKPPVWPACRLPSAGGLPTGALPAAAALALLGAGLSFARRRP